MPHAIAAALVIAARPRRGSSGAKPKATAEPPRPPSWNRKTSTYPVHFGGEGLPTTAAFLDGRAGLSDVSSSANKSSKSSDIFL
jgi:hypothetical protein